MINLKKTIMTITLFSLWCIQYTYAQTPGFVQDDIIKVAGVTTDAQVGTLNLTQKITRRTFVDGLGRAIQSVAIQASPAQNDMVQPVAYDNLGRQVKSYLPYVSSTATGLYHSAALSTEQAAFYNNGVANKVADDASPFSQQVFENSPLQRLLQSGSVGANFQPGVHYTLIKYTTNVAADNVIQWGTDGTYIGACTAGVLSVTDATDADGKETIVFKDLNGQTVLKRQLANQTVNGVAETYFDTYYIYNSAGQLIYLVPPKALALMVHNASYSLTQAGVNKLIFSYKYDTMGRLIKKIVPGSAEIDIIYDTMNRPVLMQDGNLRAGHQWNYIKYDTKNRPISQGIYTDVTRTTLAAMQSYVNTVTPGYESRASTSPYYSNAVFPNTGLEPLAYVIFDDYDLNLDGTADYSYTTQGQGLTGEAAQTTLSRGMPTIIFRRTVGLGLGNIWLASVAFYDKHGNVIQVKSNNQLDYTSQTTLTDTKTSVPDFTGKTLQTLVVKVTGTTPVTNKVLTTMNYDAATGNRLVSVDQTYNSQAAVRIAAYAYNEAGQLVTKQLGNISGTTGTTYLQNVDYRYNIQGRLTTINNSTLTNDSGTTNTNSDTNDLFGMQILYDQADANLGTVTPSYTGNISAVKWMSKNSSGTNTNERSFKYTYDKLDRFAGDAYAERSGGTGSFNLNTGYFDESNVAYDENGNILSINRKASGTAIDQLAYTYDTTNPNRLLTVTDGTGTNYTGAGFRNLTGISTAYAYASNGNLTNDYYKGLTIGYNELNRTDKITITTSRYINYTYDAAGSLIRKQAYDGGTLQTMTDYIDGFVYVNSILSYLPMQEGRVMNVSGTLKPEYIIADQQGNARFSFQNNGSGVAQIIQENSYYASGLIMPNSPVNMPTTPNKQLYNGGSEWQNDYSNLPDYYQTFYRNYDAALSRFVAVDPEAESAESMTTYQYAGNNPLANNDPMGNILQALFSQEDRLSNLVGGGANLSELMDSGGGFGGAYDLFGYLDGDSNPLGGSIGSGRGGLMDQVAAYGTGDLELSQLSSGAVRQLALNGNKDATEYYG
ncbi:MAG: hypothetical protein JWR50_1126, partial [Mucilaginibacter sp.]|nr:hypothetical protein [Mucilaginibacter sp.]